MVCYFPDAEDSEVTQEIIEKTGAAVAVAYEKYTAPFDAKKNKVRAAYAYCTTEPKCLDEVIGNKSACEVVACLYSGNIEDKSFQEHANDIVGVYFKNVDVEDTIKTIEYCHKVMTSE